jgi:hypothetical protein
VEAAKMEVMRSLHRSILLVALTTTAFAACDETDPPVSVEASRSVAVVCERWLTVERGGEGASSGLAVPEVCDGVATEASEVSAALYPGCALPISWAFRSPSRHLARMESHAYHSGSGSVAASSRQCRMKAH